VLKLRIWKRTFHCGIKQLLLIPSKIRFFTKLWTFNLLNIELFKKFYVLQDVLFTLIDYMTSRGKKWVSQSTLWHMSYDISAQESSSSACFFLSLMRTGRDPISPRENCCAALNRCIWDYMDAKKNAVICVRIEN